MSPGPAGGAADHAASEALAALLDEHLHPLVDTGRAPAVAAAAIRGQDEALLAAGRSRRGHPDLVDSRTTFQLGSITKTCTTLLLAEMAESGEVGYDDPIEAHLPPAARPRRHGPVTADPPEIPPVTLIELATHTSGLPRLPRNLFPRALSRWRRDPYGGYTRDDLYRATARLRPTPAAERVPRYSTFGIGLLGQLLADTAGVTYPRLLADRVLRPLRMHDTYAPTRPVTDRPGGAPGSGADGAPFEFGRAARTASGHRRDRPVATWTFDALAGAGAVRSSAADMCRYLRAHLHPEAVPGPLGRALAGTHVPRSPAPETGPDTRPGTGLDTAPDLAREAGTGLTLGWNHRVVHGHHLLWHTGGTGGFTAFAGFSPTADTGVAVLANAAVTREQPVIRAARRLFRAVTFDER